MLYAGEAEWDAQQTTSCNTSDTKSDFLRAIQ